ncbi:MAG: helix-turn-helix transcriptional regulator [Acetobacteraceae bacterium]
MNEPDRYLTAIEAAHYLRVSRALFDKLVREGKLPKPRELTKRTKRWDREAIDKAMTDNPNCVVSGSVTAHASTDTATAFERANHGLTQGRPTSSEKNRHR